MPVRLADAGALIAQSAKLVIKLKNDQPARLMFFTLQGERRGRKRFVTSNAHFAYVGPIRHIGRAYVSKANDWPAS